MPTNDYQQMVDAYDQAGGDKDVFSSSDVAHLVVEEDEVVGSHLVEGLDVEIKKAENNEVAIGITIKEGYQIEKAVHLCFGVLPEEGLQQIEMDIKVEDNAAVEILAHCVFPNAVDVTHKMEAEIEVGNNSEYIYREVHDHGENGGVKVIANTDIVMQKNSLLKTVFNLFEGRAGLIDIAYESEIGENSKVEMIAKISGYEDDQIKIKENADLRGANARGLLETRIALQDEAKAEILNEMTAYAAGAKGHVDCTEVIKDNAHARAVPIVDVRHPEAKVTHEAAIGSIDSTQLQTLLARGLDEEEASDVIIQGMLRG
ncbi:MAG: SufB/SufD family protein [Bacillota bacterium]